MDTQNTMDVFTFDNTTTMITGVISIFPSLLNSVIAAMLIIIVMILIVFIIDIFVELGWR